MEPWNSLTIAEQTLMRRAVCRYRLAGIVQQYGVSLRWAGAEGAPPPRSYTKDEQLQLIPLMSAAAWGLIDRGLLTVRHVTGHVPSSTDPAVVGEELRAVLADTANWLWSADSLREFSLDTPQEVRAHWWDDVLPTADTGGLSGVEVLSLAERTILVCASEASGMLTGPFGVLDAPPTGLNSAGRVEWADQQAAPLRRFVREGWIEVRHFSDASSDAMSVIPAEELASALADPAIRSDDGDDYFEGVTCVFTYAGEAVWRSGWSAGWYERLTLS